MTFSITAAGSADQVREQLAATDLTHGGDLAQAVRTFLAEHALAGVEGSSFPGQAAVFLVEANGHKDARTLSLNITVRPLWVPVPKVDAQA